jgi:hypothetical protein
MAPHASLIVLDEEWMKSKEGKERWRVFINVCVYLSRACSCLPVCPAFGPSFDAETLRRRYEKKITDYNFGSLIRTDATKEYSETNTIFGPYWHRLLSLTCLICFASICSYANTGKIPFI